MTQQKHLKRRVRERMEKTGESYTTARRHVVRSTQPQPKNLAYTHFPGSVPAAAALRILLANAGVSAPHSGEPFSEAMVFGIGGGVGAGVFAFHYEAQDISTFFIAGRHRWEDDQAWLEGATARLGVETTVRETGGAKAAHQHLQELLEVQGPVIAWVDTGSLPYRAMPEMWGGGGYHVLVVYEVDEASNVVHLGDLTDEPLQVSLETLAEARARIRKQKNRLFGITSKEKELDLAAIVAAGLEACHQGLAQARSKSFSLDAFHTLADRLHGSRAKDSWEVVFPPGKKLWTGLTSMYDFIEHYGTGGGLSRPMFAEFLEEAGEALGDARLAGLAEQYAALGRAWSQLAESALPSDVPMFKEAKSLLETKTELFLSQGEAAEAEIRAAWRRLEELAETAEAAFPLNAEEADELRRELKGQVQALNEGERQAQDEIEALLSTFPGR